MNATARLLEVSEALLEAGLQFLIMGGHAVRHYGIDRNTLDVDVHVSADAMGDIEERLRRTRLFRAAGVRTGPSWRPDDFRRFQIGLLPNGREEWLEFWIRNHLLPPFSELYRRREELIEEGQERPVRVDRGSLRRLLAAPSGGREAAAEHHAVSPVSGAQAGRAEEAMRHYVALFRDSRILQTERYGPGEQGTEGHVKYGAFVLHGREFIAMDSGAEQPFAFTEGISFLVDCGPQEEVDELWDRLSDVGETQPCGWLKDRFGVSWQIIPTILGLLLTDPEREKSGRVMEAMLKMTKIDIAGLRQAYEQEQTA